MTPKVRFAAIWCCLCLNTLLSQPFSQLIKDADGVIWLADEAGVVWKYKPEASKPSKCRIPDRSKVLRLSCDRKGNVVVATNKGNIWSHETEKWKCLARKQQEAHEVLFDRQNKLYLVTREGVSEPANARLFYPSKEYRLQLITEDAFRWYRGSLYACMDSSDRIWVVNNLGEWGCDFYAFDTRTHNYVYLMDRILGVSLSSLLLCCPYKDGLCSVSNQKGLRPLSEGTSRKPENTGKVWELGVGKVRHIATVPFHIRQVAYNPYDSCLYVLGKENLHKQVQPGDSLFLPVPIPDLDGAGKEELRQLVFERSGRYLCLTSTHLWRYDQEKYGLLW